MFLFFLPSFSVNLVYGSTSFFEQSEENFHSGIHNTFFFAHRRLVFLQSKIRLFCTLSHLISFLLLLLLRRQADRKKEGFLTFTETNLLFFLSFLLNFQSEARGQKTSFSSFFSVITCHELEKEEEEESNFPSFSFFRPSPFDGHLIRFPGLRKKETG